MTRRPQAEEVAKRPGGGEKLVAPRFCEGRQKV